MRTKEGGLTGVEGLRHDCGSGSKGRVVRTMPGTAPGRLASPQEVCGESEGCIPLPSLAKGADYPGATRFPTAFWKASVDRKLCTISIRFSALSATSLQSAACCLRSAVCRLVTMTVAAGGFIVRFREGAGLT